MRNRGPLGALPALSRSTRRALAVTAVLAALTASALVAQAWGLATALAGIVAGRFELATPVTVLAIAVAARAILAWGTETVAARAAAGAKEELRTALLTHALRLGPEWIADPERSGGGPAALTALATKGLDALDDYFTRYLPALVTVAVAPPLVGAAILWTDWPSALVIAVTVPLLPLFAILIGGYTAEVAAKAADATLRLSSHAAELVRALPVLTAFRRAQAQTEAIHRVGEAHRTAVGKTLRIAFTSALALELLATLSVALVAVLIGTRLAAGGLTLEVGLLVLILAPECYQAIRAVGAAHHASEDGMEVVRRVAKILDEPTPRSGSAPVHRGRVFVADLHVRRRDRDAPDGLSFSVAPGELVHLHSPSGTGKSTALAVLLGFRDPDQGKITVDGVDLSEVDREGWRRQIGWVPQRPQFAAATVTAELTESVQDLPGEPPRIAELLDLTHQLGIDHLLHRPPAELSAGERQRLAVARALLRLRRGAWLLLLDEPTAHLDPASATAVHNAVEQAKAAGAAVVLISHTTPEPTAGTPLGGVEVARAASHPHRPRHRPLWTLLSRRSLLGALLGATALASGIALTATSAWLIAKASTQPPMLTLLVAVVGVRTFGLGRALLRYLERLVTHDAAFRTANTLRTSLWRDLVAQGPLPRTDGLHRLVTDTDTVRDLIPRVLIPPVVAAVVATTAITIQTLILPTAGLTLALAVLTAATLAPLLAVLADNKATRNLSQGRRTLANSILTLLTAAPDLLATNAAHPRHRSVTQADQALATQSRRQALANGLALALLTLCTGTATTLAIHQAAEAVAAGTLNPLLAPVLALLPLALTETLSLLPPAAQQLRPLRTAYTNLTSQSAPTATPTRVPAPTEPAHTSDIATPAHIAAPSPAPALTRAREGVPPIPDCPTPPPPTSPNPREDRDLSTIPTYPQPPEIRLDHIDVRWPGTPTLTLRDLTLHIPPGAHTAIVGPSGAGKSTLLAVLLGFLHPDQGHATIPDTAAWSPQDPQLVSTTVRENLLLGDPHATDDELRAALRTVALEDWQHRLDTQVGVGGAAVSGGEAQRLGLARALLYARGTGVLLMDEPTAHLDEPTARRVLAAIRAELPGSMLVHVTHRAAEAAGADLVVRVGA
ncbi:MULTISPECIES: thiol reductant ABC exporter subunit CydD [unclassified Crossiella]|uniref:thiol reductant ABC exporter subunit CydD n=1 Tax=unclassified Crossiella TaxID=2620835 RepID=UPI002494871A|nr:MULTISPECIES: thiol reductant ABC exporter subunit CydD [unclassified Crossiella]